MRDLDRTNAWMLMVDGTPQSYVDLDDPLYLEFEYVRRLGHVVDLAAPAGQPLRVLHLGAGALSLARYVAALVTANDVSARQVQLTKTQFYEAKSYPTFTPVGPWLTLVDAADLARLSSLRLTLRVNGETRQDSTAAEMIVQPARALTLLSRFQPMAPGDLLLTGTPGGIGTYSLNVPEQTVASTAVSGTYGTLTVGGVVTGTFAVGDTITGAGVVAGTQITAFGTGTGGAGTYIVNNNTVVASTSISALANVETKWIAQSAGVVGELIKITDHPQG